MASLLRSKKKGKNKSILIEPEVKSTEGGSGGSQVSVREAAQENTTDNTIATLADSNSETKPDTTSNAKEKKSGNVESGGMKKGDNSVKPAWRGSSLKENSQSPGGSTVPTNQNTSVNNSQVSIQSLLSKKEAWSNQGSSVSLNKGRQSGSVVSLSKADKNDKNSQDGDSLSLVRRGSRAGEQNAYVPYIYARDCVARITEDMKSMKFSHVSIVRDMETNYKLIEDETQCQFNTYILLLRTEYSGKVKTFRQVIETHRAELDQKQHYWDSTLQSLSDRNKQLLNDKKSLLITNKLEIERLENEKKEIQQDFTTRLEKASLAAVQIGQEKQLEGESTLQKLGSDHQKDVQRLTNENKDLEEMLKSKEAENLHLQNQLQEKTTHGLVVTPLVMLETQGQRTQPTSELTNTITEERSKIELERNEMSAEREQFIKAQDELRSLRGGLQEELNNSRKESAEWQAKYVIIKKQTDELSQISLAYQNLKDQYITLSAVTASTLPDNKQAVQENLSKTQSEVLMMSETRNEADKDIVKWEKEFEEKNGRNPTEEDKSDSVREMYTSRDEVNMMIKSLERKKENLELLGKGELPVVKPLPQSTVSPEPMVTTIEVPVPDPRTLQELEASQALVTDLREQLSDIRSQNVKLQGEVTDLELELDDLREQMKTSTGIPIHTDSEDTLELEERITTLENELMQEKLSHDHTKEEVDAQSTQLRHTYEQHVSEILNLQTQLETCTATHQAEIQAKDKELKSIRERLEELEKERLSKLPPNTAREIKNLQTKLSKLEKESLASGTVLASGEAKLKEGQKKLEAALTSLENQKIVNRENEVKVKKSVGEKEKVTRELTSQLEKKEQQRLALERNLINLQKRVKPDGEKESQVGGVAVVTGDSNAKRENIELRRKVKELEAELKRASKSTGVSGGESSAVDRQAMKKNEKILKELEKKLDMEMKKREKHEQNVKIKEEENNLLQKETGEMKRELARLTAEMSALGISAREGVEAAAKLKQLQDQLKTLQDENKILTDNFNTERVLRKKYYNMVEDMKGKIRVYCRSRPLSNTEKSNGNYEVATSPDEFSIQVESSRGLKEFQFDQIFMSQATQEKVFEDTHNLIQSAVDGFNVCIFAYGQTGSGKTFTMIGDQHQKYPGVAPRAFNRIYEIMEENKTKYSFKVTSYMLELYNDHLIDLYGQTHESKLDIKKDQQGMVFVTGAAVKTASNSKELYALFDEGSKNRHVASTKMNAESSRSHLIIAVVIESTNRATGQVTRGKLSLVDLAGSERVGKTEASAEQLKEAMSINKSLSALGDVISALSSEQTFIPYRNNKLTMLMQDSLGGNAKTLMFVNISPANYNCDESIISLTYASRVKLITNSAQKNADNKEIAKLKDIINKLKQGEQVEEEV